VAVKARTTVMITLQGDPRATDRLQAHQKGCAVLTTELSLTDPDAAMRHVPRRSGPPRNYPLSQALPCPRDLPPAPRADPPGQSAAGHSETSPGALAIYRSINAVVESFWGPFWGRVQTELLNRRRWRTRIELANALFEYLEIFHNRRRRHNSLGMLTPIEYEKLHAPATA